MSIHTHTYIYLYNAMCICVRVYIYYIYHEYLTACKPSKRDEHTSPALLEKQRKTLNDIMQ